MSDDDSYYELYYKSNYHINHNTQKIFITLENINHNILDNIDLFPKKYNDYVLYIIITVVDHDYEKLIILLEKIIHCKNIVLCMELFKNLKLHLALPNLISYTGFQSIEILEFPNTLKNYSIINKKNSINIPLNLPSSLEFIKLIGYTLNNTFYNIPQNITILHIAVNKFEFDIIWPNKLKTFKLAINFDFSKYKYKFNFLTADYTTICNQSIGILPYGLEYFEFLCNNYNFPLFLPPTLKTFIFLINNGSSTIKYKYTDCINALPDNIEYLEICYISCPNITILPKSCKTFIYRNCPNNILDELKTKYPHVNITL